MLPKSILCRQDTQNAFLVAFCVGRVHMLFYWSFEGTQYALSGKSITFKLGFMTNGLRSKHMFKATPVWQLT